MYFPKKIITLIIVVLLGAAPFWTAGVLAEGQYPVDYKPSKPAEQGQTNVLTRVFAISTYMTDKINAAGGKESPVCYRNCMTSALNDVLKGTETMSTYVASEPCETTGAQKMSTCNPKCQ